ncbi:hypothetical protein A2765_04910 [Candidatus Kaiserbacteria bacterium RIFCSPHIGHO2_01_FULL_56_24]|uniref:Uncharacterized protein n=1 Tax=Candidatus Kaiserbacteria bacterium RIFCSPHIGHO2_01_FULL_56_24 TaxID=1798487 RepID=A0A1F6DEN7_9BACT|nr:MAG: hypothetical protein A2765_04910 [Candidatus Kaiserbacteria bacterium RIFCSPHIGHO2_01_FULL_56_24]
MLGACARVGGANAHIDLQTFLKSFPPKSSASYFLNLTIHAREARGTAKMYWLSLLGGKESQYQNASFPMSVPKVVRVYRAARTYFQSQSD